MSPRTSQLPPQPWLAICEFPSFQDAKAFQALVAECLGETALIRRKLEYRKQGAFAEWRTTRAFREAFGQRSFDMEMLASAALSAGYCGSQTSVKSWLVKAKQEGLVAKVGRGEWQFLPADQPEASTNA